MTKRITLLNIENCRAYLNAYEALNLENGENVLIYGENGSGKSSLYKAINNYLAKSNDSSLQFVKNRYLNNSEGEIRITFAEFSNTLERLTGTDEIYRFGSLGHDNNVSFIQIAAHTKGFLDYTDLLKVYLHKEERPNLFELIVLSLLGNHIPLASGGNFRFKNKWNALQDDLIKNAFNRNSRSHKSALIELPNYEIHLRSTLDLVFHELNRLLREYFQDLNIQLNYSLNPLDFNYGGKWAWHTTANLSLTIFKDGVEISGNYGDFLNEARLSAIAICLYLASLLQNPTNIDLKVLFLDDVFIGLDAGNRIPILNILRNEFPNYQKFISTYDRHWFELAKRHFEVYNDNTWSTLEIYVGNEDISGINISKPILVKGQTNYEKAIQYLHNRISPDYPASANYFRKSIEELIQNLIPKYELVDIENVRIDDYKLTSLLIKTKLFLEKINESNLEIVKIIGLLQNLIHPLSHHEITLPIYKSELQILEGAIPALKSQLLTLDISNNYRCILGQNKIVRLNYTIDTTNNHLITYEVKLKESIILKRNGGTPVLSKSKCHAVSIYGTKNGNPYGPVTPPKNDSRFQYNSLEQAFDLTYNFLLTDTGINFPRLTNYLDSIEYYDGSNWVLISGKSIW